MSRTAEGSSILLVEDREDVRSMLLDFLECLDYRVHACGDPESALQVLETDIQGIGLVLTDVLLESSTGPQMVRKIREMRPDVPVIYMSGYPEQTLSREISQERNCHFLQKPFSLEVLNGKIRELMPEAA